MRVSESSLWRSALRRFTHLGRPRTCSIRQLGPLPGQCPIQCPLILLQLPIQRALRHMPLYAGRDCSAGWFASLDVISSTARSNRVCQERIVGVPLSHGCCMLGSNNSIDVCWRSCIGSVGRGRWLIARWNHSRLLSLRHRGRLCVR